MKTRLLLLLTNVFLVSVATAQRTINFRESIVMSELYEYDLPCLDTNSVVEVSLPITNGYQEVTNLWTNAKIDKYVAKNVIAFRFTELANIDTLLLKYDLELEPQLQTNQYYVKEPAFVDAVNSPNLFRGKGVTTEQRIDTAQLAADLDAIAKVIYANLNFYDIEVKDFYKKAKDHYKIEGEKTNYQQCLLAIAKELNEQGIRAKVVSGKQVLTFITRIHHQYLEVEVAGKVIPVNPIARIFSQKNKQLPAYHTRSIKTGNGIKSNVRLITCAAEIDITSLYNITVREWTLFYEYIKTNRDELATLQSKTEKLDSLIEEYTINAHIIAEKGEVLFWDGKETEGLQLMLASLDKATLNYERSIIHLKLANYYEQTNQPKEAIYHLGKAQDNSWASPIDYFPFDENKKIRNRAKYLKLRKRIIEPYMYDLRGRAYPPPKMRIQSISISRM